MSSHSSTRGHNFTFHCFCWPLPHKIPISLVHGSWGDYTRMYTHRHTLDNCWDFPLNSFNGVPSKKAGKTCVFNHCFGSYRFFLKMLFQQPNKWWKSKTIITIIITFHIGSFIYTRRRWFAVSLQLMHNRGGLLVDFLIWPLFMWPGVLHMNVWTDFIIWINAGSIYLQYLRDMGINLCLLLGSSAWWTWPIPRSFTAFWWTKLRNSFIGKL